MTPSRHHSAPQDEAPHGAHALRTGVMLTGLVVVLALVSLAWGERGFTPEDLRALMAGDPVALIIVGEIRAPRIALAAVVGSCLAVSGAIAQAVMRNPLAEPGLLGISGGASLGTAMMIILLPAMPGQFLPLAGFGGAALMAGAIYALAWRGGTSSIRLILMGIGLGALAAAATSFLLTFSNIRDAQRAMAWMAGSLFGADWTKAFLLLAWSAPAFVLVRLWVRELDLFGFGDEGMQSLGMHPDRMRGLLILLCTLLAGAAVALVGPIGFIGLIAPHLARRAAFRHAALLPLAALWGALLMIGADLVGRLIQLPAGLLTPLVGVPFIALLLWRRRRG